MDPQRRITLNLGLRYDRFSTYYPVQQSDPNETFPAPVSDHNLSGIRQSGELE